MAWLDNLVSYWKMDESSGTRNDSHGTNHLTDNNTVTSVSGKLGNAAEFVAANNEYLSLTDNASIRVGSGSFTFTAWVKFTSRTVTRGVISKYVTDGYIIFYHQANNWFRFEFGGNGLYDSVSLANDTWYFIVAWHDSAAETLNIQVNNGTVNSTGLNKTPEDNTDRFAIGSTDGGTHNMDGLIDDVGFWKRVLTVDERLELYNGGAGLVYPFNGRGRNLMMGIGT